VGCQKGKKIILLGWLGGGVLTRENPPGSVARQERKMRVVHDQELAGRRKLKGIKGGGHYIASPKEKGTRRFLRRGGLGDLGGGEASSITRKEGVRTRSEMDLSSQKGGTGFGGGEKPPHLEGVRRKRMSDLQLAGSQGRSDDASSLGRGGEVSPVGEGGKERKKRESYKPCGRNDSRCARSKGEGEWLVFGGIAPIVHRSKGRSGISQGKAGKKRLQIKRVRGKRDPLPRERRIKEKEVKTHVAVGGGGRKLRHGGALTPTTLRIKILDGKRKGRERTPSPFVGKGGILPLLPLERQELVGGTVFSFPVLRKGGGKGKREGPFFASIDRISPNTITFKVRAKKECAAMSSDTPQGKERRNRVRCHREKKRGARKAMRAQRRQRKKKKKKKKKKKHEPRYCMSLSRKEPNAKGWRWFSVERRKKGGAGTQIHQKNPLRDKNG